MLKIIKKGARKVRLAGFGLVLMSMTLASCGVHKCKETHLNMRYLPQGYTVQAPAEIKGHNGNISVTLYS